jgi:hypothetical protein
MEPTNQTGGTGILAALRNGARSLVRLLHTAPIRSNRVTAEEQDRMTDDGAPSRPGTGVPASGPGDATLS